MAVEVGAARRRIIRRPRLTAILDDSSARVRLLVAPAGYGKTTLAREWLGEPERRAAWYRGGPASADVAALAIGLAEAARQIVAGAGSRMRERLRATGHPEEDVDVLAELFAEDVQAWPADAWLALDDYQYAMESPASERFVEVLTQETPIQLLVTSRRRPTWATARRIVYGEVLEIDRRALAMEDSEARALLGHNYPFLDELVLRAHGWPAVLGLAAISGTAVLPRDDIPARLHTFFAQEIFETADSETQNDLVRLSAAPSISLPLITEIFGQERGAKLLDAGKKLGVLDEDDAASVQMHPLLREYLRAMGSEDDATSARIGEFFLQREDWDSAYEVAVSTHDSALIAQTIEQGLESMLRNGRLATLQRWIDGALAQHVDLAIVDLAEAELAFRQGDPSRAYTLASHATRLEDRNLSARAHVRAGHSALLASKEAEGLDHFRAAVELAETWDQRREALVGLYFAGSELDAPDAHDALSELDEFVERTPDGVLRLEVLRLTRATRAGGIVDALADALPKLHLADRAEDPLGLTAFLHMLATALNHASRYSEALEIAEKQAEVASRYRLELPVVHALLNNAISHLGLKAFGDADNDLGLIGRRVPPTGDPYLEATARAIAARVLIARHRFVEAVALTDDSGALISSPPLRADYLSTRALALACAGNTTEARRALGEARSVFPSSIELRVLSPCVEYVLSIATRNEATVSADAARAWTAAEETGNYDSFVSGYRAVPKLLVGLANEPSCARGIAELLARTQDDGLARQLGLSLRQIPGTRLLTPREVEVVRELEQGFTNREIARRLFVSEATVKAHLRHIYEKLGVRTRTELLARRPKRR